MPSKKANNFTSGKAQAHKEKLHADALERQAIYDVLSTDEKLALIASRRGESKKEKARLS